MAFLAGYRALGPVNRGLLLHCTNGNGRGGIDFAASNAGIALGWGEAALMCAVLGAIVGSFLGAALVRLPRGETVISGRSRCDACGKALGVGELVPIAAFLIQRGRCRSCAAAIDRWAFAAEVGGAAVAAAAALFARDPLYLALGLVLGWQLLLLGLLDARHFWLPDRLVALLMLTGAIPAALAGASDPRLLAGPLVGAALGFALLWLPARLYRTWRGVDGLGQGDPKLLGAIGLWLGPVGTVETLLGAALLGLLGAGALAAAGRPITARTALPLGSCLALAGFAVYLSQN